MSVTLALNTNNLAPTQYLDYRFNSTAEHADGTLVASDDGLFLLGGDSDDGVDISAGFKIPDTDFELSYQKHIRSLDLSYSSDGDLSTAIFFDGAYEYTRDVPSTKGAIGNAKIDGRRSSYGRNFCFSLQNVDGSAFVVYGLSGYIVLSIRRTR